MEGWEPKLLQKRSPIRTNLPNVKEKHRCGPRWPTSSPSLSTTATSASSQDPLSLERSSAFYYFTQFRFVVDISYHCYKFICSICSCKCVHNFRHSIAVFYFVPKLKDFFSLPLILPICDESMFSLIQTGAKYIPVKCH